MPPSRTAWTNSATILTYDDGAVPAQLQGKFWGALRPGEEGVIPAGGQVCRSLASREFGAAKAAARILVAQIATLQVDAPFHLPHSLEAGGGCY
jgi:hypothetical protein